MSGITAFSRSIVPVTLADLVRLLPTREDYKGLRHTWRGDVLAGVTVAIVALPLALAFGITTGMGAAAGVTTAIIAGAVAAVFGGSNVQVSGPTGAMTAVLVPIVHRHGIDAVLLIGLMAGLLVVVGAWLRMGRYFAYIPWPVVEGFTVGIAVIIGLQQLPAILGVATPNTDGTLPMAWDTVRSALTGVTMGALAIAGVVVVTMLVVARLHRSLPASLIAIVIATVVADVLALPIDRIGALPATIGLPSLPTISTDRISLLFSPALAVALLVSLESLLSAKVADGMVDRPRHDPDRELFGQGLANLVAPMFGGMPATGAIARTAVNVRSGARTRAAALVHAVVLLAIVMLGADAVGRIPLAALAGVLVVTAIRMVDPWNVRAILRATRQDGAVLVVTACVTVLFDLILAVEIGIVVAAGLALRSVALTTAVIPEAIDDDAIDPDRESGLLAGRILTYRLDGALFFGAAQRFLAEMTAVTDVRVVILRLPQLQVLDATGAQVLGEIIGELEGRGITVLLKGARANHLRVMRAVGALDRLADERHVFVDLEDAVIHARVHIARPAVHPV
ncbi:MAG: SulP family inorganic anion transporter [Candidatus Limnocylindrales bacterium]